MRALGLLLGVDHSAASRLLAGTRTPSWETFVKLCEVLDLSADSLIDQTVTSSRLAVAFESRQVVEWAQVEPGVIVMRFVSDDVEKGR